MKTRHLHTKGAWVPCIGTHPDINPKHPTNSGTFRLFPHVKIGMRGDSPDQLTINVGCAPLPVHDANACLIAAAPKMLAALENPTNEKLRQEALAAAYLYEKTRDL
jgi:hypothetical protein